MRGPSPSRNFVRNHEALTALDAVGRAYGIRPSAILGVEDEWAAYQLDVAAVVAGGRAGEAAPAQGGQGPGATPVVIDARRTVVVGASGSARRPAGYRDPSMYVSRKMKLPASGTW